jgi:AraC-like DNA-binding protein
VQEATASTSGILNPAAGQAHFALTRLPPARDLAEFVERHWIVSWDLRGRPPFEQQLLPHPCVNLAFIGDHGAVHGIPRRRASRTIQGRGWVLGTKFRPGGFAGFSAIPMPELVDRTLSLEQVFGRAPGAALASRVSRDEHPESRIAAVESFLRERLPVPDDGRRLTACIVRAMLIAAPRTRVEQLASDHGVSVRGLQRLFRRHVGVSPKWVLSRYRLHEAAERIGSGECGDLSALAYELGYADQSHFNRDFRALVGMSPAAYARACATGRRAAVASA